MPDNSNIYKANTAADGPLAVDNARENFTAGANWGAQPPSDTPPEWTLDDVRSETGIVREGSASTPVTEAPGSTSASSTVAEQTADSLATLSREAALRAAELAQTVREKPGKALGIAAAVGFVIGLGLRKL